MKYYTFLTQFHPAILEGRKHSTIRGKAKADPGERFAIRHWTDKPYRSKMGFLGTAVCVNVTPVEIWEDHVCFIDADGDELHLYGQSQEMFAKMEGFANACEMFKWFSEKRGFPFLGILTVWDPDSFIPGPPEAKS